MLKSKLVERKLERWLCYREIWRFHLPSRCEKLCPIGDGVREEAAVAELSSWEGTFTSMCTSPHFLQTVIYEHNFLKMFIWGFLLYVCVESCLHWQFSKLYHHFVLILLLLFKLLISVCFTLNNVNLCVAVLINKYSILKLIYMLPCYLNCVLFRAGRFSDSLRHLQKIMCSIRKPTSIADPNRS